MPIDLAFKNDHERVVKLLLDHNDGDPYEETPSRSFEKSSKSMIEKAIEIKWHKLGHFIFWQTKVN